MKKNKLSVPEIKERKTKAVKIIKALRKLFPNPKIALRYSNNQELFVAVVLSAQCTDKKVNEVTEKLFSAKGGSASGGKKYKTVNDFANADLKTLELAIYPTGFYRNKAKNIIAAAKELKERFNGKMPKTMAEMLTLPGIGRKSANVILGNAYGVVEGIAVDTHVRRLSKKLGLTKHDDPVKIERDLMKIIPKKDWFEFTYLLIDYGRKYCVARSHAHENCPLSKVV
ncbi:MAG: endonuclease III [bacterium]|nr:endonuclease III [bacterium]